MTFESAFAFLQQPHIAVTICAIVCGAIALIMRKYKTVAALAVLLVALHLNFWAFSIPNEPLFAGVGAATLFYVALLLGFFAVAIWDKAWAVVYVALMPVINWSFGAVQTFPIPEAFGGGLFQPLAIVTGLVLVVRDFAQRELKHWVWGAMVAGLILSSLTSWITVVVASGLAFLVSETVDWAVYTFSKKPFSQRIMISSAASAPLDQVVFIGLASLVVPGIFAWGTVLTGIASKLFGAWVVSQIVARQERRAAANEMKAA
jgi:uncharacterized PurR-regulated membrane protein YhhQ (DUF165 family)